MSDTLENTTQQPDYLSYLLRLWRMKGEAVAWRGSIESPQTGERLGFGSLDALCTFLREQTGSMPGTEGAQSPTEQRKGGRKMSLEEMKAKIRWAGEEAWLKGNLDALDEVYAANYVWHRPPFPDTSGIEAVKESIEGMRSAYSDLQVVYEQMVGEGSTIAYQYSIRAKHTGVSPTMPIPPTGKEVALVGCVVVRIEEGKIIEEFEHSDSLGFLQQLGVVPPLG
jgi:predicted ester cyclase